MKLNNLKLSMNLKLSSRSPFQIISSYQKQELTGTEFNEKFKNFRFFKLLNNNENHYNLQYKTGLIIDPRKFCPYGECNAGGLYFTHGYHIYNFLIHKGIYMFYFREVTIPDDAKVYVESLGKIKADKIIVGERKNLYDLVSFMKNKIDQHTNIGRIIKWGSYHNRLDVIEHCFKIKRPVHIDVEQCIILACKGGYLDIVKFLLPQIRAQEEATKIIIMKVSKKYNSSHIVDHIDSL
jgi:hypothetical protein